MSFLIFVVRPGADVKAFKSNEQICERLAANLIMGTPCYGVGFAMAHVLDTVGQLLLARRRIYPESPAHGDHTTKKGKGGPLPPRIRQREGRSFGFSDQYDKSGESDRPGNWQVYHIYEMLQSYQINHAIKYIRLAGSTRGINFSVLL